MVLLPEPPGRWRSLRAEVVEVNDERLRVRAPDDHFSSEGECLLKRGQEFEAARDEVETVNID